MLDLWVVLVDAGLQGDDAVVVAEHGRDRYADGYPVAFLDGGRDERRRSAL